MGGNNGDGFLVGEGTMEESLQKISMGWTTLHILGILVICFDFLMINEYFLQKFSADFFFLFFFFFLF